MKTINNKSGSRTKGFAPSNQPHGHKSAVKRQAKRAGNSMPDNRMDGGLCLGECTAMYAASLADPFCSGPDGACIPDSPALMTSRRKVFTRGTFTTSTNAGALGTGWIAFDPFNAVANNVAAVAFNAPAQPTNVIDIVTSIAGTSFAFSNAEYAQAAFLATGVQARVVSAGLKIRNITAVLQRGGFVAGLAEPAHSCLQGFGIPTLDSYVESERFSGSPEKWTSVVYRPVDTDDLDFRVTFNTPALQAADSFYMGFIVQAPDSTGANPQLYEYEATVNVEYQGARVTGKQPSHADPLGYSAVNATSTFARAMIAPSQEERPRVAKAMLGASQDYIDRQQSHASAIHKTQDRSKKKKSSDWDTVLGIGAKVIETALPSLISWLF